ncbi:MAG: site-2 protease family protein [Candidatus Glassbacteria bacterium]
MEHIVFGIPVLLFSVVVHEYAHGFTAYRAGDPTAMLAGRLTLNPIPHIDLVGSVIVPLFLVITNSPFFIAWAKPVPVNPLRFRNGRKDETRVALAGPMSNVGLALLFTLIGIAMGFFFSPAGFISNPLLGYILRIVVFGVQINLLLAVFNLIPIPPLDGSHILSNLLPPQKRLIYEDISRYGFIILMLLIVTHIIDLILIPVWKISYILINLVEISVFG